ncbi:MAG: hypothetical protein MUE31_09315 [Candidatus Nanopelagicales bacterium]|nr:hypothetical protein [Candidatus Nanopelagicales bacterium]
MCTRVLGDDKGNVFMGRTQDWTQIFSLSGEVNSHLAPAGPFVFGMKKA